MQEQTDFTYHDYWERTILPSFIASAMAFVPMIGLRLIIGDNVFIVLAFAVFATIWTSIVSFVLGINKRERTSIIEFAKNKLHKNNK